ASETQRYPCLVLGAVPPGRGAGLPLGGRRRGGADHPCLHDGGRLPSLLLARGRPRAL
ncbi:MAG: hypothetical protein AVDCRST_MAG04-1786, partial [uncultured Acetobacteraceae bacterium]